METHSSDDTLTIDEPDEILLTVEGDLQRILFARLAETKTFYENVCRPQCGLSNRLGDISLTYLEEGTGICELDGGWTLEFCGVLCFRCERLPI